MSESTRLPSTLNSTRETPTLSEAVAASAMLPVTVAPEAGAVIETVGSVVSAGAGSSRSRSTPSCCPPRQTRWP